VRVITADTTYSNNTEWWRSGSAEWYNSGDGSAGSSDGGGGDDSGAAVRAPTGPRKATPPSAEAGNGTRGAAVCEVVFEVHLTGGHEDADNGSDGDCGGDVGRDSDLVRDGSGGSGAGVLGATIVHGVLSNGEAYDFALPPPTVTAAAAMPSASSLEYGGASGGAANGGWREGAELVGREVRDGWWARGMLADGALLLTKGEGYRTVNRAVGVAWAREQMRVAQLEQQQESKSGGEPEIRSDI